MENQWCLVCTMCGTPFQQCHHVWTTFSTLGVPDVQACSYECEVKVVEYRSLNELEY